MLQFTSRTTRGAWSQFRSCRQCRRKLATDSRVFAEGDIAILREKNDPTHSGILTKPLNPSQTIHTHRGPLPHSSIIGKRIRDTVSTSKGTDYRVHEPTLAEYVRLTPRLVTPIYPGDANLIVSLLDIHVSPPTETSRDDPPLEILEAGTGHGALTLHLARAIHAANTPSPPIPTRPRRDRETLKSDQNGAPAPDVTQHQEPEEVSERTAYDEWKSFRRAIVHTLDISPSHSAHARKIVRGFRHGLYYGNVDFHVGDVSAFIRSCVSLRSPSPSTPSTSTSTPTPSPDPAHEQPHQPPSPFLSHAFLDLPSAHTHLELVASALRVDGALLVFNPSITQIAECVQVVREKKLPLVLEQVVELGPGTTGGRQWDVRAVRPRAQERRKQRQVVEDGVGSGEGGVKEAEEEEGARERDGELAGELEKRREEWAMVCRPKVYERVVGGGFLGVWRRMREKGEGGGS